MAKYIALLRGINVGSKWIKMAALKASFEDFGAKNVQTYIQSGNVVFDFAKTSPLALEKKLKAMVLKVHGHDVPVFVLESSAFLKIIAGNPFLKQKGIDLTKLHVSFLSEKPAKDATVHLTRIAAIKPERGDEFILKGQALYLHCPKNFGETKFSSAAIEKACAAESTTRNWKTVCAISELLDQG